jgi:hypothetical protein
MVDAFQAAIVDDGCGVIDIALSVNKIDHRRDSGRMALYLLQGSLRLPSINWGLRSKSWEDSHK